MERTFGGEKVLSAVDVNNVQRVGEWSRAINGLAVSLEIDFVAADQDTSVEEALEEALRNRKAREDDLKKRKEIVAHQRSHNPPPPMNPLMAADDQSIPDLEKCEKALKGAKQDVKDLKLEKSKTYAACNKVVNMVQTTVDASLNDDVLDALNNVTFKNDRVKQTKAVIKAVTEAMSVDFQTVMAKLKAEVHRTEQETPENAQDLLQIVQRFGEVKAQSDAYSALYTSGTGTMGVKDNDLVFAVKQVAANMDNNEVGREVEKIIAKANEVTSWTTFKRELSKELKSKTLIKSGKKGAGQKKVSDSDELKVFKAEIKELKETLNEFKREQSKYKGQAFYGQGGDGVCYDWKNGNCTRGESCRFKHTPALRGTNSQRMYQSPPRSSSSGTSAANGAEDKKRERSKSSPSTSRSTSPGSRDSSPGSSRGSSPSRGQRNKLVKRA